MAFETRRTHELPRHASVISASGRIERGSGAVYQHIYPANGEATCELVLG